MRRRIRAQNGAFAEQDRVAQLMFGSKATHGLDVVGILDDGDEGFVGCEVAREAAQRGQLGLADAAPRRPEVQKNLLAAVVTQHDPLSAEILEGEIRSDPRDVVSRLVGRHPREEGADGRARGSARSHHRRAFEPTLRGSVARGAGRAQWGALPGQLVGVA
jgi:hypothetical protein